jgi:hypothetical protein
MVSLVESRDGGRMPPGTGTDICRSLTLSVLALGLISNVGVAGPGLLVNEVGAVVNGCGNSESYASPWSDRVTQDKDPRLPFDLYGRILASEGEEEMR